MLPDVVVRTIEYVPAGVLGVLGLVDFDVLPPPQAASPIANSRRVANDNRRRLEVHNNTIKAPTVKTIVIEPSQEKSFQFMPAAVLPAAVAIVTVKGTADKPLKLNGAGLKEHVAPLGKPAHEKLADPE
jgi:hypothetical protein